MITEAATEEREVATTIKTRKPRQKRAAKQPARKLVIRRKATPDRCGWCIIDIEGQLPQTYRYTQEPVADGVSYTLTKLIGQGVFGETYRVVIAPSGNSCECKGFRGHGHCKHEASFAKFTHVEATKPVVVCSPAVEPLETVLAGIKEDVQAERPLGKCRRCCGTGRANIATSRGVLNIRCHECGGDGKYF